MRKIIIKYALLSLVLCITLTTVSCNKWLNVSPKADMKAEDLFSNETGFRDGLIGVYALMSSSSGYGQRMTYGYMDVLAQYYDSPLKPSTSGYDHNFKKAAQYVYTDANEESRISSIWNLPYKAIANINLALEYIDTNKGVFSTEDIYSLYKGEYIALRAFLHFDVLRLFAPSPKMNGGSGLNAPAIPYVDKYTNVPQPQLTVKEALIRIENDLIEAKKIMKGRDTYGVIGSPVEDDLPEVMKNRQLRMNYMAVTALLARVYLYEGNHSAALREAKEIIGEVNGANPTAFGLTTGVATSGNPMFNSELIFTLDVQNLKKLSADYFIESFESTQNILTISQKGKDNLFDGKGLDNDFRINWLTVGSDGISSMVAKFKDMKFVPLLKLSELYLIAAEAASGQEGLDYLNKLRSHRGLSPIVNTADLNVNLYKEYRREFIGEGQLFFFYKRNLYEKIGSEENIAIGDAAKIYNLPIPVGEKDFGNIK